MLGLNFHLPLIFLNHIITFDLNYHSYPSKKLDFHISIRRFSLELFIKIASILTKLSLNDLKFILYYVLGLRAAAGASYSRVGTRSALSAVASSRAIHRIAVRAIGRRGVLYLLYAASCVHLVP